MRFGNIDECACLSSSSEVLTEYCVVFTSILFSNAYFIHLFRLHLGLSLPIWATIKLLSNNNKVINVKNCNFFI